MFFRFVRCRRGNVSILFALSFVGIAAASGVALDMLRAHNTRASLQAALDGAVLSAVSSGRSGSQADAVAKTYLAANFAAAGHIESQSYAWKNGAYTGTAEATIKTTLSSLVGMREMVVQASATAGRAEGARTCILLTAPSANQALLANGGASIVAPECEIHVSTTANTAAIINGGTTLDVKRICIRGSRIIKNTSADMPIETSCATAEDTIGDKLKVPSVGACTNSKNVYDPPSNGRISLTPGVYCNVIFNGSPTISFAPGLYIIKGTMIVNSGATITGEGVTFYFPDVNSKIQFNGGLTSKLTAPKSGDYAGVLMFENPAGTGNAQWIFNGTVNEEIEGLIYLPKRDVTYNSSSNISSDGVTMVYRTLLLNKTNWKIKPGPYAPGQGGGGAPYLIN